MLVICCVWACTCVSGHAYSWRHVWKARGWFWVSCSIASPTHPLPPMYFPEPHACRFGYVGWPTSPQILLFSTPHHTDVHSHIWLLCGCSSGPHACVGSPWPTETPLWPLNFLILAVFRVLSSCAKKTCLEGQDWLCTSLALGPLISFN